MMLAALVCNMALLFSCPGGHSIAPTACGAWSVVRSYRGPVPLVRHGWRPLRRAVRVVGL